MESLEIWWELNTPCISFPAFSSSRPGHEHCLFNSHLPVPSLFPPRKPLRADLCRCGYGFGDLGRGAPLAAVFLDLSSMVSGNLPAFDKQYSWVREATSHVAANFCVPFISSKKSPMHGTWSLHWPQSANYVAWSLAFGFSCSRLLCALHLQQEESNAWDLEPALTSICKLCSLVTSFWFQVVFKATS